VAGIFISNFGHYRWVIWVGWSLTTLGIGILTLLDVHTSTVEWIFMVVPLGIGIGLLFPSMNYAIQAAASNENSAFAASMFPFARVLGQCFGIAIGSVLFQNALKSHISRVPEIAQHAAEYAADGVALLETIRDMPLSDPGRAGLLHAYALALQDVWRAGLVLAVVGLLTSMATKELSLDRKLEAEQGFIEVEKLEDSERSSGISASPKLGGSPKGTRPEKAL
jgi:hypothetical protein